MNQTASSGGFEESGATPDDLISTLQRIQEKDGYLSESALRRLADESGRSLTDLYGVATFYKSFSLEPRGKHLVSVCVGTACHVRGAPVIAGEFERELKVKAGETTEDKEFTLTKVNCLGACALGPIVVVDGNYAAKVDAAQAKAIVKRTRRGIGRGGGLGDVKIFLETSCPCCNHSLMDPSHEIDGHPSIRVTVSFERRHGCLRLSSLYGSYSQECEYEVPMDSLVEFFCPHCHSQLRSSSLCGQCAAPTVPMLSAGGGMVRICSRRGCKDHMLDLNGVNF